MTCNTHRFWCNSVALNATPNFLVDSYGHSFGVLSHYYGREAGLELREDIDTVLEPGMVVSMEPMITVLDGQPGAGGYREHDILVVGEDGAENITKFPFGPEYNIIGA
ncbi:M24 family metallopeptidase [Arthrobacter sp. AZCC_0090]|uniref:M24 family metallopeptidase n=1 Tax=Arthrobacter sp. AZCC_0090 TaxID=2735881 RepID=UPI0037C12BBA